MCFPLKLGVGYGAQTQFFIFLSNNISLTAVMFHEGLHLGGVGLYLRRSIASELCVLVNVSLWVFFSQPYIYKDLDFGMDQDTRVALVGPNGAGKSTLLKLLSGEVGVYCFSCIAYLLCLLDILPPT